ncbi:cytochrome b/b6 domain-containing protein [Sandarakinorhabdus sp.]|uniref:cytochrome b/b6 domain-containing protein n=1 Tax=Sandarakinorhabdus sp. TaxID=1916663 RepID=UPI003F728F77
MTLSYLLLALGVAVLLNLGNRWARVAGQVLAAIALFFNVWSIWLAVEDGTFDNAAGQQGQVLALLGMGLVGAAVLLGLLLLLPGQWREAGPVPGRNGRTAWGQASRILHWASAVLMLCALPMGYFVVVLPAGAIRAEFLNGHQGVGLAVLVLLALRLGWQLASAGPDSPNALARLNKAALYALLAGLPVSGLLLSGALRVPVLGIALPALLSVEAARAVHQILSALFVAAFAAHAGAVLWHHFGLHDRALVRRMLR